MILVDTSVWVDHLSKGEPDLAARLEAGEVLAHPFVIDELALGNLRQREVVLGALADLPAAVVASDPEVLALIERQPRHGLGIGYVDAHLWPPPCSPRTPRSGPATPACATPPHASV